MNKKIIIISSSIIVVILLIISFYSFNNKATDVKNTTNIDSADKSSITQDSYYVEPGLEKLAKIVKPAVENFANQDKVEKNEDRIKRLEKYFTNDSPVYEYEQNNITGGGIEKSVAKVTSVVQCDSQEDGSFCLNVMTSTTFYLGSQTSTRTQTYGITVKYINDSYTADDIGVVE